MEIFFPVGNIFSTLKLPNSFSVLLLLVFHYQDNRTVKELPVPIGKGLAWDKKGNPLMLARLSRTVHSTGSQQWFFLMFSTHQFNTFTVLNLSESLISN